MPRHDRDRGAAAVEFALVFPLLILLVLGIAEFGRAYNVQSTITAAARQGARVMALRNNRVAAVSAAKSAASPYTVTDGQVSVTPDTCAFNTATPDATTTVTVRYPLTLVTGSFGPTITLVGKGVMRCNG